MIPEKVTNIMAHLISHGYEAFICGGAVRDTLLGIEPHDWDVFTDCDDLLTQFPDAKIIGGEERQAKILTVIVDDVEVSQYRKSGDRTEVGNDLKTHCSTCDFTINAMAMNINGKITDYHNGRYHLNNKMLCFVGKPKDRINEDPLRVLRGLRFISKYGLTPTPETSYNIYHTNIKELVPKERIREELVKIISLPVNYDTFVTISNFLPDEFVSDSMLGDGGDFHDECPLEHLQNAFLVMAQLTDNPLLRLSALLHDIGKAVTRSVDEDGKTHFYEHEKAGADIVEKWMLDYKFSKDDIKFARRLIKGHMYSYKDKPSKKSYTKFFQKLEDSGVGIEDYVMLLYADHQGNMAKPRIKFGDFIKDSWIHKMYYEIKFSEEPIRVSDLKVSGKDVMEILGIPPGKEVGVNLNAIFELVMDGTFKNERAELLNLLKKIKKNDFVMEMIGGRQYEKNEKK